MHAFLANLSMQYVIVYPCIYRDYFIEHFSCLQFPLPAQRPDMRLATAREHTAGFRPRNPMEEQIAALLHGSKSTVSQLVSEVLELMALYLTRFKSEQIAEDGLFDQVISCPE